MHCRWASHCRKPLTNSLCYILSTKWSSEGCAALFFASNTSYLNALQMSKSLPKTQQTLYNITHCIFSPPGGLLEGCVAVFLSSKTQELFECVADEQVTDKKPNKLFYNMVHCTFFLPNGGLCAGCVALFLSSKTQELFECLQELLECVADTQTTAKNPNKLFIISPIVHSLHQVVFQKAVLLCFFLPRHKSYLNALQMSKSLPKTLTNSLPRKLLFRTWWPELLCQILALWNKLCRYVLSTII